MNHSVGKLLPVDGFRLSKCGELPVSAYRSLTHLYQPIIGQLAVSLYQVLVSEYDMASSGEIQTHHTLMSYLSVPLDKIYEARKKLEAIGLLQTYRFSTSEKQTEYLYRLHPPFAPEGFFLDNMLAMLLYHELGSEKYEQLKRRLVKQEYAVEGLEEVTATFGEVFHSQTIEAARSEANDKQTENYSRKSGGPFLKEDFVDFEWLQDALKKRMYPSDKILTGANKRLITQLASLYNLSLLDIEKAVTWAIDENHRLVADELKAACHDFMKEKPSSRNFSHIDQREKAVAGSSKSKSKGDQFIDMLEQISPRELLEDLSGGNKASDQDLKLIRDVMTEQGLSPGVMNVLVHYVMLKTDMKLSKAYMEKIAGHWTRKNVTTVRQAMNLAKAEHQKYQQWGNQNHYKRKSKQDEVIPAWFNQKEKNNEQTHQDSAVNTDEIAERIKRLTNKGN